jgi:hypothetical protein
MAVAGNASTVRNWPGTDNVQNGDRKNEFGEDLSGLFYVYKDADNITTDTMYAIRNSPSTIYKLSYLRRQVR